MGILFGFLEGLPRPLVIPANRCVEKIPMTAIRNLLLSSYSCIAWGLGLRSGALSLVPTIPSSPPPTMLDFAAPIGSGSLDAMAIENVKYLRNKLIKMENVVTEDTNTNRLTRGLVVSLLMLIVVAVAATISIRPFQESEKTGRRCPLEIIFPSISNAEEVEGADKTKSKPIDDSPIDWDSLVLTSDKFKCVFDPKTVTIDRLLSTPPPTFIRKDGGSEPKSTSNQTPKYVTVSD